MNTYHVSSLPLKDVIIDLSKEMKVNYLEKCTEYFLELPTKIGAGQIRGINFDNGLGILIYDCSFKTKTELVFTNNDIHPVKYLYSVEGDLEHSFEGESEQHEIPQYKCVIVASGSNAGHKLRFKEKERVYVISLEIDRAKFLDTTSCEINSLSCDLKSLFKDIKAERKFFHEGYYGLEFQDLLSDITSYTDQHLVRKFHLESKALNIFVKQLAQFDDDNREAGSRSILRVNELSRIEEISNRIKGDLSFKYTIENLSSETGLNSNKLQAGFKHLFGTTVNDYILKQRIEKATLLLMNHDYSINRIGEMVGFDSNSYFSKVFKKATGFSPKRYRDLKLGL